MKIISTIAIVVIKATIVFLLFLSMLSACSQAVPVLTATAQPTHTEETSHITSQSPTPTSQPPSSTPLPAPTQPPPTLAPTNTPPPAPTSLPLDEQRIEFQAEDGTPLVGSYFPGASSPSPVIVLMHQAGANRQSWASLVGMVAWLQNRGASGGALYAPSMAEPVWPPMPMGVSFAVFTFDFRSYGESGGKPDRQGWLMDARAALKTVQGLPGVNLAQVLLVGASIGGDAAVDVCTEGCLGALSLSPGSFLDLDYAQAVTALDRQGKTVLCLASQGDTRSAQACQSASGAYYQSKIFPGDQHGENLLLSRAASGIGQLILDFVLQAFHFG